MTPRNCLLATTHFPITTRRYNKRSFLFQLSFYWEVSETSSFMRQQPLEMKKRGKVFAANIFLGNKKKSFLTCIYTHFPSYNWSCSFTCKILHFKENRLSRTLFSVNTLPGLREFINITNEHCLCMASTTDLHEEQKMAIWRAFVSCWYPTAFKTRAKSDSELSACSATSAPRWLSCRRAAAGRYLCSAACHPASSSSLSLPSCFIDILSVHIKNKIKKKRERHC